MSDLENLTPSSGAIDIEADHRRLIEEAIEASLAPNTRRAYSAALRSLQEFAAEHGYPWLEPATIAAYLSDRIDNGYARAVIGTTTAAVKRWCLEHGHADVTVDAGLQLVVRGLRRKVRDKHVRRAHPLSLDEITRLVSSIDTSTNRGRRDVALTLVGINTGFRRSSLVSLDRQSLEIRKAGIRVELSHSKVDQEGTRRHSVVMARGKREQTDVVVAVTRYLASRGPLLPSSPLFVGVTNGDRYTERRLTDGQLVRILQKRAREAGMDIELLSGHSLRAGTATILAEAGVPAESIAKVTDHRSVDVLVQAYIRPSESWSDPTTARLGL